MSEEKTINDYLVGMYKLLEEFEQMWKERIAAGDEGYPLELKLGDWDEQFASFLASKDRHMEYD